MAAFSPSAIRDGRKKPRFRAGRGNLILSLDGMAIKNRAPRAFFEECARIACDQLIAAKRLSALQFNNY
jgi:hypothetical protein